MKRAVLFKYARKIHKWAGLLLGIQLVLWITGGFVMSSLPRDNVLGRHLVEPSSDIVFSQADYRYAITNIINGNPEIQAIHFSSMLDQPAYKVETAETTLWINANTGQHFEPLTEQQIRELASERYAGDGQISSIALLKQLPMEMRNRKATMWQVSFDDWMETTFYMTPDNGAVVRVRSDLWRFYDFFWMLHIMDYSDRDDSHNWLLIVFSFLALVFSLTGVILWFQVFKKRDFVWKKRTSVKLQKA